jgi:hypothetical protein
MRFALHLGWYRTRIAFGQSWGGYLALVILIGLLGGLTMASVAGARRTQTSFTSYLASTNPSNLQMTVFGNGGTGSGGADADYSSSALEQIAGLPGVKHVEAAVPLLAVPLQRDGAPILNTVTLESTIAIGSVDGLFFNQDRLVATEGRVADPNRANEIVMTATAAQVLGFHVGQRIPYGLYSGAQENLPGFGTARVPPHRRVEATLVGIVQLSTAIVQDDIDRLPTFVFFTPAFTRQVIADKGQGEEGAVTYGLQLEDGNSGVAAVERHLAGVAPADTTFGFHAAAPVATKVDLTLKPLAIGLGAFGVIAALATLLISLQLISRQLIRAEDDLVILRALGADPLSVALDRLIGILASIAIGSLVATVVAVALSPLAPLGPVRPVYPGLGIAFDWTVLGIGFGVLVVGLSSVAAILAYRNAPQRLARRPPPRSSAGSKITDAIAAPLPPSAGIGVRFALSASRGRTAVPTRPAMLGGVLAVALVVATLTFGSSLQALISHPALYGWNFDYLVYASNNVPPQALSMLRQDHDVAAWTGYDYAVAEIDNQYVPFLFQYDHPQISPPILSGHAVEKRDQIVLGAATMAQLHKHIGDTVTVSYGAPNDAPLYVPPTPLVIVGTATMPAVGFSSVVDEHTSMGTGAVISEAALPAAFQSAQESPNPTLNGPNLVFVRLRAGVANRVGLASLNHVANVANRVLAAVPASGGAAGSLSILGVQRPAEIVNYGTIGAAPAILASALALGAIVALALTLVALVRRRRRDLALLRMLGFTQRQLAAVVAWQASVTALVGVVVGVPLGIAAGRWLWVLFADQVYAVPHAVVPAISIVIVAIATVGLANLAAALPALSASRTSPALLLRTD